MNQSISINRCQQIAVVALLVALCCARAGSQEVASATAKLANPPVVLETLVSEVLENNPELNFYKAEIAAAIGGRRQAGIYENPEFSADAGRKRARGGGVSTEGEAWSVSVLQTFEYPGRITLRKAIANQNIKIAELGYEQFKAALRARARELGYNLLITQQKAEAATDVAERLRQLLSLLVQREPAGITPLIELRIIEASVVTFRKQAIEAAQALQSALFDVNLLRGKPLATPLQIAATELIFPLPPELETFLASARQNNFDIQMRLIELEQQGFKLFLSKNLRWPKISVGPFVSQEKTGERETIAGFGISLPLPLWNRNAGNVDVAIALTGIDPPLLRKSDPRDGGVGKISPFQEVAGSRRGVWRRTGAVRWLPPWRSEKPSPYLLDTSVSIG